MRLKFLILPVLMLSIAGCIQSKPQNTQQKPSMRDCNSAGTITDQISCFAADAKKINNHTACNDATNEGVKYQCYAMFAEYSKDAALCNQIPITIQDGQELQDVCKLDVVKAKTNIASDSMICDSIITHAFDDECYEAVAKGTGNQSICEQIKDSSIKDRCYGRPTYVE